MTDPRHSGTSAFHAAGATDVGRRREVNEDRFHCDPTRGLFFVIDGVGGQAAGGKAADVALSMLRARLERETGPVADRGCAKPLPSRTTRSTPSPTPGPSGKGWPAC